MEVSPQAVHMTTRHPSPPMTIPSSPAQVQYQKAADEVRTMAPRLRCDTSHFVCLRQLDVLLDSALLDFLPACSGIMSASPSPPPADVSFLLSAEDLLPDASWHRHCSSLQCFRIWCSFLSAADPEMSPSSGSARVRRMQSHWCVGAAFAAWRTRSELSHASTERSGHQQPARAGAETGLAAVTVRELDKRPDQQRLKQLDLVLHFVLRRHVVERIFMAWARLHGSGPHNAVAARSQQYMASTAFWEEGTAREVMPPRSTGRHSAAELCSAACQTVALHPIVTPIQANAKLEVVRAHADWIRALVTQCGDPIVTATEEAWALAADALSNESRWRRRRKAQAVAASMLQSVAGWAEAARHSLRPRCACLLARFDRALAFDSLFAPGALSVGLGTEPLLFDERLGWTLVATGIVASGVVVSLR